MNLDNVVAESMDYGGTAEMYASMPLKQYIQVWLDTFKSSSLKQASFERLKSSLNALDGYFIAQMKIKDITAFHIQRYVNELADHGYARTTIKKQTEIVTAPLKQAAAMHFIQADPSAGISLPKESKLKKKSKQVEPYTEEEQNKMWEIIESSDVPATLCIGFMLETGLRVGELMALRWKCVDIDKKRLTVNATIIHPAGQNKSSLQTETKSRSSMRIIPLTQRAIEILEKLKGRDDEWVFTNKTGGRISYNAIVKHIQSLCKKIHAEYRGAHAFRHTFATNCYYKGMDVKILSKLLGHSDIRVTMNIYVSLRGDGFEEMYAALAG